MHEKLRTYLGCLAVAWRSLWRSRDEADHVYDTAGNLAALKCNQCGAAVDAADDLSRAGRCDDCEPISVVFNVLSPIGFVIVSVRPIGAYATRDYARDIAHIVDRQVEEMKQALTPCADCDQLDGVHKARCPQMAEFLDMSIDAMPTRPEKDEEEE